MKRRDPIATLAASAVGALALALSPATLSAQPPPYGLESRAPIGPYLNNVMPPKNGAFSFPPVLSATGAFSDLSALTPSTGIIPFTINSPLWSDGALKSRWMAVPNDGPPYASNEQISFVPVGEWGFPNGTVFIKHFELTVNEGTGERKRLETRFLVRDSEGAVTASATNGEPTTAMRIFCRGASRKRSPSLPPRARRAFKTTVTPAAPTASFATTSKRIMSSGQRPTS